MQAKDLIVTGASRLLGKLKCLGDISTSGKVTATNGFEGNVVGNVSGSAGTAGEFTSAKSVTLTGDVTGTASSKGGWSIATTVADDSHNHTASTINVPKMTKSYTGVIGTENNAANGSFYFIKVAPTTYNGSWTITYTIDASMSGVSDANGGGRYHGEVYIAGMRNTYSVYYIRNEHSNTSYRPIYYHELYRAKEAGATTYGHALGVGLRNAYGPANSTYARSITVKILDYSGCTITLLDTPVKYASWIGTGSTNYDGLTSFDAYTQGIRMVGDNAVAPEVFVVTFTYSSGDNYTANKTYSEITAAYNAGKIVYGKDSNYSYIYNGFSFMRCNVGLDEDGWFKAYIMYYENGYTWCSDSTSAPSYPTLSLSGNTLQLKQTGADGGITTLSSVSLPVYNGGVS